MNLESISKNAQQAVPFTGADDADAEVLLPLTNFLKAETALLKQLLIVNNLRTLLMRIVLFLMTCVFLNSCGLSQKEKDTAIKLIDKIDSIGINSLQNWDYSYRGFGVRTFYRNGNEGEIWYSCRWLDNADSVELLITSLDFFNEDFGVKVSSYEQFTSFKIRKYSNCIKLFGLGESGLYQEIIKIENADISTFFSISNPFDFFKNQIDFYDNCGIIEKSENFKYGGFIQFKLTNGYVLSYLPTDIEKNEEYINGWSKEMERGDMIKANWNYRKTE